MTIKKATLARSSTKKTAAPPSSRPAKKSPGKTKMGKAKINAERVTAILKGLRKAYPDVVCALHHTSAWELTVATILSAQCTDVRVNMVTPALFKRYPTPKALADAPVEDIEQMIRTTGFYHNKAKSIQGAARRLLAEFGGVVPNEMDKLLTLPGVARKTANVVLGSWFGIAVGVVVDTHVMRLSQRLELTKATAPGKIEQDLVKILPYDRWIQFSHELIHHGRAVCVARKPRCPDCTLEQLCNSRDKTWSTH